ncbi:MAG: hypothetical protein NZ750_08730 [Anaerolineae bacterium]|nr:hypothetical protein [Anaerolineae bacterium]MDW8172456.1 hypothetical protein [Anaerolineae bacterium]
MRRACVCLLLALVACTPAASDQAVVPPAPPVLQGRVDILGPTAGWIVYDALLTVYGTAEDVPPVGFLLRVLDAEGATLVQTAIVPEADGRWQTRLLHGYHGEPGEITLRAESLDPRIEGDYDSEMAAISGLAYRPEGRSAALLGLAEGQVIGGEQLLIQGSASGFEQGQLLLRLETRDGTPMSQVVVPLPASFLDEVIWQAELVSVRQPQPVVLRLLALEDDGSESTLQAIRLQLSVAAG